MNEYLEHLLRLVLLRNCQFVTILKACISVVLKKNICCVLQGSVRNPFGCKFTQASERRKITKTVCALTNFWRKKDNFYELQYTMLLNS